MIVEAKNCRQVRRVCDGKLVVAAGTFDLLHFGHVTHLQECRRLGDSLAVIVSSDARVREKKGSLRPIVPCCQRAKMLEALECVDAVIIGYDPQSNSPGNLVIISDLRPEVFVTRNPAWNAERGKLKSMEVELKLWQEDSEYRVCSTTEIIERVIRRYQKDS